MESKWIPDWEPVIRYRRFMREFDKQRNVQVGLQLFLAGIGLAALALIVFIGSFAFASGDEFYTWVQFAYAPSMLAAPVVILSIAVLLQPERETLRIAVGGVGVTAVATFAFLLAYPGDWYGHGNDYTLYVVGLYAIGFTAVTYVMGVSLKSHAPKLIQTLTEIRPADPYDSSGATGTSNSGDSAESSNTGGSAASGTAAKTDDSTDSNGQSDGAEEPQVVVNEGADATRVDDGVVGEVPDEVTLVVDGERYTFGDGDTFGRQEADWLGALKNACGGPNSVTYVSGEHLEFAAKDDGVYVTDTGRNGTALNGEDLNGDEVRLEDGDTIVLADRAEIDVEL